MMYNNLKNAMLTKKITSKQIAELLGIAEKTVSNKIHGKTDWSYIEVIKIKQFVFPEYDTDWLFSLREKSA